MFSTGLDVLPAGTVVDNIHLPNYPSAMEHAPALRCYLDEEVASGHFLRTSVIDGPIPARTCPIAVIPKPDQPGAIRLITDASAPLGRSINDLTCAPPFRMVAPADVFARCDENSWAAKTDIKCAFRNNPLNPLQAGLLAIEFEGFYYWELRSPFGWSLAPFSWCKLTDFIQRYCALHGHNDVVFVDDFLHMAQSEEEANASQDFLLALLPLLGLAEKTSKRVRATKNITFLGFVFDFPSCSVSISDKRATSILKEISVLASGKMVVTSCLQSTVGKLVFASQVVRGAQTFTRRLFDAVAAIRRTKMLLSPEMKADLGWWRRYLQLENGSRMVHWSVNRLVRRCCSDASDSAGGGIFEGAAWIHAWSPRQKAWHINIKELWAVFHSLLTWSPSWKGQDVLFAVDNSAAFSWINSGTARSPQAMALLRRIYWICARANIRLRAVWIPSELNFAADAASRLDFDRLFALTGIPPGDVITSGDCVVFSSLSQPSLISLSLYADHLQTLSRIKSTWPSWLARVYAPRPQTPPEPPSKVPGGPSFGFSWPSNGLPHLLLRVFSSAMPPGCTSVNIPSPPSVLMLLHSQPSTSTEVLKCPLEKWPCLPWAVAFKESDAARVRSLKVRRISPLPISEYSVNSSTSVVLDSWPTGQLCVSVSSHFSDLETWFQNLRKLGNPDPSFFVAMCILLSGVSSFKSEKRRHTSSWTAPLKSRSRTSKGADSVRLLPSGPSLPSLTLSPTPHSLPSPQPIGLLMPPSETSLSSWRNVRALTQVPMPVTAPEVVVPPLPQSVVHQISMSKPKAHGHQMRISATSAFRPKNAGTSRLVWRRVLPALIPRRS